MICKSCGEDKKHYAHGLCVSCYKKQRGKLYYEANHDKICRKHKIYREANRTEINATRRKRRYERSEKSMSENKTCASYLGVHVAERILSKVFKDVKIAPPNNPGYDFICNKGKRIDVKSSCISKDGIHKCSWAFHIGKNKIADFFLCLAFDNRKDLTPLHIWSIPSEIINHLHTTGISESTINKWNDYKLDIDKVVTCCDNIKPTKVMKEMEIET